MQFTEDEIQIRQQLATIRKYPRWKKNHINGYCYYMGSESFVEEAFRERDGTWSVDRKSEGAERGFVHLSEALQYGKELAGLNTGAIQAITNRLPLPVDVTGMTSNDLFLLDAVGECI